MAAILTPIVDLDNINTNWDNTAFATGIFQSDEVYIDAFHATGCPNKNPYLEWWRSQSEEAVLNDMNTYCELIRDGHESDEQRSQCCGGENCTINECVTQIALTKGTQIT